MEIPGYVVLDDLGGDRRFRLLRGRHADDQAPVLLKVPAGHPVPPRDAAALEREWKLARQVRSTAVPVARELNARGDIPCLVLEDPGLDLLSSRAGAGRATVDWILSLATSVCTGLHELHEQHVVLGRLSPTGLLVDATGDTLRFADMSWAWIASLEGSPAPALTESTAYISPEQTGRLNRAVDYRCDFYGLGILLYELLVGHPPCTSSDTLELIHFHVAKTPVAPSSAASGIPEQVSRIVMRLLAKDPEDRYQSALGVRHDLAECARQWRASGTVSPFDLARHDVPTRFVVPRKLYGRERELATLTRTFEETCHGETALLLVGGYSGVGKTSLISELYRPIVRQRGYFSSGKVDQVVRNIPYGPVANAFRRLVWQLLTESEERLSWWRERLSVALGANGEVLVEVIPELEHIVGRQPPAPRLDPSEAQNRFRYVFQSFVATLAGAEHPLVVFLDDMQWADSATLDLLHAVLTAPDIRHLLIIGAYRDNEVDADHLLTRSIERFQSAGARVHRMSLAPLGFDSLLAFLVDTIRGEPPDVEPLARLILAKTAGNPFFVIQFLKTLVQDRLLTFDAARGRWVFRIGDIEHAGITDNVVDLMTGTIQRLSPRAQATVTLAACIGSPFEWDTLLTVSRQAPDQVAGGLAEALDAGLIERVVAYDGSGTGSPARASYAFVHDRVQQAAYGLIPDDRRMPIHLDVGRLLLARYGEPVPEERLFEIANQFNLARSLVTSPEERRSVARLNLAAARKAKTSTAYRSASGYLEHGIALAPSDWSAEYDLLFALHLEAAECQYLAGDFDRAEQYFRLLLDQAATRLHRAQVHALRITLYEHQSRWEDALASGRDALALFGLALPGSAGEKEAALERELAHTRELLGARSIASLTDLPVVADADVRMSMRILTILWATAYLSGDHLLARLISATMVRLSLAHGNTEDSAYGYVTHAITIGPIRHDYASAFAWGELALAVNAQFQDARRRAKIHQQFQAHVNLWCRPFTTSIPYAREARRIGLETGDFTYAGYGAASEAWLAFLASTDLGEFIREYTPTIALLQKLKMNDFQAAHRAMLNWALALQGRTSGRLALSNEEFDEARFIATVESRVPFFLTFLYVARLHLGLLLEDYPFAIEAWKRAREVALPGTIWPVIADAWGALAVAAGGVRNDDESWLDLTRIRDDLGVLAGHCPENFRGLWLLVSAELERAQEHPQEAADLCEQAITFARDSGAIQLEALANERCASALLAAGHAGEAVRCVKEAHRCYGEWGALVKVRDLEARHEYLRGVSAMAAGSHPHVTPAAPSDDDRADSLDMRTVLKLARAVAVEIDVDGLLRKLMTIAMENAGAKRGAFIVAREHELTLEAEGQADPEDVQVGPAIPLESTDRLPRSIVQYVRRTGCDVVVGNAAEDDRFRDDPYVARAQTRSVLCVPVSHQGRLGGILYLENDLTTDAFTPARAEMMRIVAAQAAISLENARLYGDMKREVARRTEAETALRHAMTELETLKNRLQAENVYLQEEIQTQHNFTEIIGNSAALRESLRRVERVAPTASTVLITGETGTGKEVVARAIHSRSARSARPLVKVNCGAIPAGLVESELFGHVKGAFTGALQRRVGRFELADGGSIFLDEVGELPLDTQVKLLRVLQEQEFEPVGATRPVRVDVRVIAATNRDLEAMVRAGSFRADLFYRLNVFPIAVPPLRERREDIPVLVAFFLTTLAKKLGKPLEGLTARSLERLRGYDWPGNVRELQNVIERAAILSPGPVVQLQSDLLPVASPAPGFLQPQMYSPQTLEEIERQHILSVVSQTNWTIEGPKGAAVVLGLHPNTLRSRMKRLGIARPLDIS